MRLNAKKTVETYNYVLQGVPLIHSSCIENLINNCVTVGVIWFSVFFYWYGIPFLNFRVGDGQRGFWIKGMKCRDSGWSEFGQMRSDCIWNR